MGRNEHIKELTFKGRLITSQDPVLIAENFRELKNMRPVPNSVEGVKGQTKVNTTALSNTHLTSIYNFRKSQPDENYVITQAFDSNDANPTLYINENEPPTAGDFNTTAFVTEDTSAGECVFSDAPNGNMIACDGVNSYIWGGNEMLPSGFIASSAPITTVLTNPKDYIEHVKNSDTDTYATVGSGGVDTTVVCMLHMDDAGLTDSSLTTPHTTTLHGSCTQNTSNYKFAPSSMYAAGGGGANYLTIARDSDFDFTGGQWTIDFQFNPVNSSNGPNLYYDSSGTPSVVGRLQDIAYGNSLYIAVGDNITGGQNAMYSSDLSTWNGTLLGDSLYSVATDGTTFVAVGTNGGVYTTTDGVTWIHQSSGTTNTLKSVKYVNNKFIAVGSSGTIITSTSGSTWADHSIASKYALYDISFNGSTAVATGYDTTLPSVKGIVARSTDGSTWTVTALSTNSGTPCTVYHKGEFYAYFQTELWKSSDDGLTWTNAGNANYNVYHIHSNGVFLIGTALKPLISLDGTTFYQQSLTNKTVMNSPYVNSKFVLVGTDYMIPQAYTAIVQDKMILYDHSTDSSNRMQLYYTLKGALGFKMIEASATKVDIVSSDETLLWDTWQHIAIQEDDDDYTLYHQGVSIGTANTTARPLYYTQDPIFGVGYGETNGAHGYFDEARVSKGAVRYPTDFTPPESPYTSDNYLDFVVRSTRPLKGVKFYIKDANTESATLSAKEYTSSGWQTLSIADGTSGLSQTGSVTFNSTEQTSRPVFMNGDYLYTYMFTLSNGNATIYEVTVDAPPQPVKDIWNASFRTIGAYKIWNGTSYLDYSTNVYDDSYDANDDGTHTGSALNSLSGYQVFGFVERTTAVFVKVFPGQENTTAGTFTMNFWNGSAWEAVSNFVDGTSDGSAGFAKSGVLSWTLPNINNSFVTEIGDKSPFYYYKLVYSTSFDASTRIYYVSGIPQPKTLSNYKFALMAKNRVLLCNDQKGMQNSVLVSASSMPDVYNGDDSTMIYFGDGNALETGISLYSRMGSNLYDVTLFFKNSSIYGLTGEDPTNYKPYTISTQVGCNAPHSLQSGTLKLADGNMKLAIIWQGMDNVYMFDNDTPVPMGDDIKNIFDLSGSDIMHTSYRHLSRGFLDVHRMEYHLLWADSSSTGELNRESVYNMKEKKWFEIDRLSANRLSCGAIVLSNDGVYYTYGGAQNGHMYRLENGTSFDGSKINQVVSFGDIALHEGSVMFETIATKHKLIMKNTGTASDVDVTYYADTDATGVVLDSIAQTGSNRCVDSFNYINQNAEKHIFHSLKYQMQSNDTEKAFQPLFAAIEYRTTGKDVT